MMQCLSLLRNVGCQQHRGQMWVARQKAGRKGTGNKKNKFTCQQELGDGIERKKGGENGKEIQ